MGKKTFISDSKNCLPAYGYLIARSVKERKEERRKLIVFPALSSDGKEIKNRINNVYLLKAMGSPQMKQITG